MTKVEKVLGDNSRIPFPIILPMASNLLALFVWILVEHIYIALRRLIIRFYNAIETINFIINDEVGIHFNVL